jgi:hypothetical protein
MMYCEYCSYTSEVPIGNTAAVVEELDFESAQQHQVLTDVRFLLLLIVLVML